MKIFVEKTELIEKLKSENENLNKEISEKNKKKLMEKDCKNNQIEEINILLEKINQINLENLLEK